MYKAKLQGLKKSSLVEQKRSFSKYIVFGSGVESCIVAQDLARKHGELSVCWLTETELSSRAVTRTFPTSVRGDANVLLLQEKFPDITDISQALFYKDMKFRSFTGRSKPMPLLGGETFYTQTGVMLPQEKSFSDEEFAHLLKLHKIVHIEKIVKVSSFDLLEKSEWELHTANHEVISCQYLIWGDEPLSFHHLIEDKADFGEIPNFLAESESLSQLYVSFTTKSEVIKSLDTFFIPLSLTHSEGHFIGQFLPVENGGEQKMDFIHFFDESKYNEDEIIKKIKSLKRSLQKIYDLDKYNSFLTEYYSLRKIDVAVAYNDLVIQPLFQKFPTLLWVGENAPLQIDNESYCNISHYMRAVEGMTQFQKLDI